MGARSCVSCCGRILELLILQKATDDQKLTVKQIENDWYITSKHPCKKVTTFRLLPLPQEKNYN